MMIAEAHGLPVSAQVASATPHEIKLVDAMLTRRFVKQLAQRLIGDGAYDGDQLDEHLAEEGIQVTSPRIAAIGPKPLPRMAAF